MIEEIALSSAFSRLSERAQRHLPFIGLFEKNVHAGMPGEFPRMDGEKRELYEGVMGEVIDTEVWKSIFEEAHQAGLVDQVGEQIYSLHSALSALLRQKLAEQAGPDRLRQLDIEFVLFYAMWAFAMCANAAKGNPGTLRAIEFEEGSLLRAVRIAEQTQMWADLQAIAQTLYEFYRARDRKADWLMLRKSLLSSVGTSPSEQDDAERANLRKFLTESEGS